VIIVLCFFGVCLFICPTDMGHFAKSKPTIEQVCDSCPENITGWINMTGRVSIWWNSRIWPFLKKYLKALVVGKKKAPPFGGARVQNQKVISSNLGPLPVLQ